MNTPSRSTGNEEKRDAYVDPKGCLMIFDRPAAYKSRHRQKLMAREDNAATLGMAVPTFLKWSKTTITFDKKDHPITLHSRATSPMSSTRSSARHAYPTSSWMVGVASTSFTPRPKMPWACREQPYGRPVLHSMKSYPDSRPSLSGRSTYL